MAASAQSYFTETYAQWLPLRAAVREDAQEVSEELVQCVWYDQIFDGSHLETVQGHKIRVVSPGWWNQQEGPDFRGAQIEFNGALHNGDVEIHLYPSAWREHGHQLDARYDNVILHVLLDGSMKGQQEAVTSKGRAIPSLVLRPYLREDLRQIAARIDTQDYPHEATPTQGKCAALAQSGNTASTLEFLRLAGEWRMIHKARQLRQRMEQAGDDQAVYELFMYACGFSHFKQHFRALARALPYERARQLALLDPLLLEAAFLHLAGLLPEELPEGTSAVPHFARLRALRRERLEGLRTLPLEWRRNGVRPINYPERRMAGAARVIARTAQHGLVTTLDTLWKGGLKPIERRRQFEELFPRPMGFWATHCTWAGKTLDAPVSMLGEGRARSIIGNVFIPAGLATARRDRDRVREERILLLFAALPREPENQVTRIMLPRLGLELKPREQTFQIQQGLLQMHMDWCEPNPSCRNCSVLRCLQVLSEG